MNTVMNTMGDAIANLQVDQDGNKPAPQQAVLNLLDKLNTPQGNQELDKIQQRVNTPFVTCLKYAGILTIIVAVMSIPAVQQIMDKLFANDWMKMGAQCLLFFIIATVFLKKAMNSNATPTLGGPTPSAGAGAGM